MDGSDNMNGNVPGTPQGNDPAVQPGQDSINVPSQEAVNMPAQDGGSFTQPAQDGGSFGQSTDGSFTQDSGSFGQPADGGFAQDTNSSFTQPAQDSGSFGQPAQDSDSFSQPSQDMGSSFTQPTQDMSGSFGQPADGGFAQDANSSFTQPAQDGGSFGQPADGGSAQGGGGFTQPPQGGDQGDPNYIPREGVISSAFAASHPEMPQPPAKKRPILPLVLALVVLLLLGAGIVCFLMRDTIANTWASMTMEPDEYFRYVMNKELNISEWIGEYDKSTSELGKIKDMKTEGEIRLELNDDLLEYAETNLSTVFNNYKYRIGMYGTDDVELDLSAYENIALNWEMERTEERLRASQNLQLKDRDPILNAEEIYDIDSRTLYAKIPELNEDYAGIDFSGFLKDDELEQLDSILGNGGNVREMLPSSKTMQTLYDRYFKLMLDQIKDVEKDKESVEVNGVSRSLTTLRFSLDEDTQRAMTEELLNTIKEDDELEDLFYNFTKQSGSEDMAEELWTELTKGIDDALDKLDDQVFDHEPDVTVYVASDGSIAGVKVEEGMDYFFGAWIMKGTKLYSEISCVEGKDEFLNVTGVGSLGLKGLNMDFHAVMDDGDLELDGSLENVGLKGGTFRMDMEPIFDKIVEANRKSSDYKEIKNLMNMLDGELVIRSELDGLKSSTTYALEDNGSPIVSLSYVVAMSESKGIDLPAKKNVTKIKGSMDFLSYAQDCEPDKFLDAVQTLGLPKQTVDELRNELKMLKNY
ncbi:MAG: hypothetical protein K6E50_03470 [Lachnospiraceae bacterium]|nr:hypothetical protein [Lachnospiraceae bacterium]